MNFPTNRHAWRKAFPDGLSMVQVQAAFDSGLMIQQRYDHAFRLYMEATTNYRGDRPDSLREQGKQWRYKWEPKKWPKPNAYKPAFTVGQLFNQAISARFR